MSRTRYRNNMPPGLKAQIVIAVIITLSALLVLPTALSARQPTDKIRTGTSAQPSSGSVATTTQDFTTTDFGASAFADWD